MIGFYEIFNKHRKTLGRKWSSCTLHLLKIKPPLYRLGEALRFPGD
jgi:hypothetical protein